MVVTWWILAFLHSATSPCHVMIVSFNYHVDACFSTRASSFHVQVFVKTIVLDFEAHFHSQCALHPH